MADSTVWGFVFHRGVRVDFGGVVSSVLKGRQYRGAQWNKIPAPYLVALKLNDRQISLYVRLSAAATTSDPENKGSDLPSGIAEISVRDWAKKLRATERTLRRDLKLLELKYLIRYETKSGSKAKVAIIDPRFIPAIGALATRSMPHLAESQLWEILEEIVFSTRGKGRTSPHPMSEAERRKEFKKQSLELTRLDASAAPRVPIEGNLRKEFLEIETQCETIEDRITEIDFQDRDALSALLNAALDGPPVASEAPSATSGNEMWPSASEAAPEPLKSGEDAFGVAGKVEDDFEMGEYRDWALRGILKTKSRDSAEVKNGSI